MTNKIKLSPDILLPMDMRYVMKTKPPKIDFVLPSLPAGAVGVLSGAGGTGKSLLALQLMFAVAAGKECDFSLSAGAWQKPDMMPAKTVYLSIEDPIEILHTRLHHIIKFYQQDMYCKNWLNTGLLDLIKVYPLSGAGFSLMNQGGNPTQWFRPIIDACKDARIVFIDTMRRAHDADENDNGTMSVFLKLVEIIAAETGAAVVLLHHENKASMGVDDAGAGALRGASAIVDNARWVSRVRKMTTQEAANHGVTDSDRHWHLKLSLEKTNYGPPVEAIWLERQNEFNGVLKAVELTEVESKHGGRNNA